MPRPKPDELTVQIAARLPLSRLVRIDAYAKEHALSRNLAMMALIDAGLSVGAPVKAVPAAPVTKADEPSRIDAPSLGVQFGPSASAPGSRLDKKRR